jgi:shikimate dehydrogenase
VTERPSLAAVIGWPVAQSVSPLLHNFWLKQHGIKGAYIALPVAPENFARCVGILPLMGFAGASITVPHKEAAFALAAITNEDARATRAVNTLIFEGEKVRGLNTDVVGFASSLAESLGKEAASAGPAAVLGAGGAARAVVEALLRAGAPEIRLINRTQSRAENLASQTKPGRVKAVAWGSWTAAFADTRLLINATSLGMTGKSKLDIPLDALPRNAAVADIVYNPLETELLAAAKARGHRTMDGLGMLMYQAVPAFAAWFGVTPKVTPELRAELERAVGG